MTLKAQCDEWSMKRMNIPQRLWNASFTGLPDNLRGPVKNYIRNLDSMLNKGVGFFLYGASGTGKTSAGSVILKAGWERMKTGYFTTVKELRHAVREEESFDGSESIMERCRNVDILVLDDLAADDFKNFTVGIGEVEHLLSNRSMRSKTTVLTTRLQPDFFRAEYPSILQTMQGTFVGIPVTGQNHKAEADAELRRALGVQ